MDFVLSARNISRGQFGNEPGTSRWLMVPAGIPTPAHGTTRRQWVHELLGAATWGRDSRTGRPRGDIVVFVHGYNNSPEVVMRRHRSLAATLTEVGFKGVVMSFDWPSDDKALGYLEDRHDAKRTAMQLVHDGIALLADMQERDCTINVHLLGHSTGAYVIREAFDDADDAMLSQASWLTSQVVFVGADISAASMRAGHAKTDSLFRHCQRLTNYSNLHDSVLKLSNVKRAGVAPRVGRVGLPDDAPGKAVDVDCSAYFKSLDSQPMLREREQSDVIGSFPHSWHIGNRRFARDLFETLRGDVDRSVIDTRVQRSDGRLELRVPE